MFEDNTKNANGKGEESKEVVAQIAQQMGDKDDVVLET